MAFVRLDHDFLSPAKSALIYEGTIARTHLPDSSFPLSYASGNEWRDEDELRNILKQVELGGKSLPVTWEHPDGLVSKGTPAQIIGAVIGARIEGDHVVARIVIEDQAAWAQINDGTIELSMGYVCTVDAKKFQRSCALDHLAVVPAGRCLTCRLNPTRQDAHTCDLIVDDVEPYRKDPGGLLVATTAPHANLPLPMQVADLKVGISLDEKSEATLSRIELAFANLSSMSSKSDKATVTPQEPPVTEHADCSCKTQTNVLLKDEHAMDELKAQLDAAVKALEVATARVTQLESEVATKVDNVDAALTLEKAEAKVDAANARIDALTAELATAKAEVEAAKAVRSDAEIADFQARVDARVTLLDQANKVGIEGAKALSDVEIKLAVIKKVRNKDVKKDADAKYVDGMFDIAMDQFEESQTSVVETFEAIEENKEVVLDTLNHDPLKAEREASARRLAASKDRWKQ